MTSKQRPKQKEVGDQVLWLLKEGGSRQQEQQGGMWQVEAAAGDSRLRRALQCNREPDLILLRVLSSSEPQSDSGFKSSLWLLCSEDCRAGGGDMVGMMLALLLWEQ